MTKRTKCSSFDVVLQAIPCAVEYARLQCFNQNCSASASNTRFMYVHIKWSLSIYRVADNPCFSWIKWHHWTRFSSGRRSLVSMTLDEYRILHPYLQVVIKLIVFSIALTGCVLLLLLQAIPAGTVFSIYFSFDWFLIILAPLLRPPYE